jgi:hypothetical protein
VQPFAVDSSTEVVTYLRESTGARKQGCGYAGSGFLTRSDSEAAMIGNVLTAKVQLTAVFPCLVDYGDARDAPKACLQEAKYRRQEAGNRGRGRGRGKY